MLIGSLTQHDSDPDIDTESVQKLFQTVKNEVSGEQEVVGLD